MLKPQKELDTALSRDTSWLNKTKGVRPYTARRAFPAILDTPPPCTRHPFPETDDTPPPCTRHPSPKTATVVPSFTRAKGRLSVPYIRAYSIRQFYRDENQSNPPVPRSGGRGAKTRGSRKIGCRPYLMPFALFSLGPRPAARVTYFLALQTLIATKPQLCRSCGFFIDQKFLEERAWCPDDAPRIFVRLRRL